jgi:CheY-like chemotaxis protein
MSHHSEMVLQRAQNRSVLIAEDEELLRVAISKSLRKSGFSVLEARNGSEAMELMCENIEELEAVLLDVTLPGTSSREIVEEARRIRPNLRIVVTSAYGKGAVDQTFLGLPIHHFIRKPFSVRDLIPLLSGDH